MVMARLPHTHFIRQHSQKIDSQKTTHKVCPFAVNDNVYIKDFPNAKKWMPGKVIEVRQLRDGYIVRRYVDALRHLGLQHQEHQKRTVKIFAYSSSCSYELLKIPLIGRNTEKAKNLLTLIRLDINLS